jgi:perosamine synthetase
MRASIARDYNQRLQSELLVLPPLQLSHSRISWFVYVVRLRPGFRQSNRDAVLAALNDQGIRCARYFAPVHLQPVEKCKSPCHRVRIRAHNRAPLFNRTTPGQIDRVCEALSRELRRF